MPRTGTEPLKFNVWNEEQEECNLRRRRV